MSLVLHKAILLRIQAGKNVRRGYPSPLNPLSQRSGYGYQRGLTGDTRLRS